MEDDGNENDLSSNNEDLTETGGDIPLRLDQSEGPRLDVFLSSDGTSIKYDKINNKETLMSEQQCQIHSEKITEIGNDVKAIKKTLNGNGEMGLVGRVIIAENWINKAKKRRDWVTTLIFRIFITAILVTILKSVGLK